MCLSVKWLLVDCRSAIARGGFQSSGLSGKFAPCGNREPLIQYKYRDELRLSITRVFFYHGGAVAKSLDSN